MARGNQVIRQWRVLRFLEGSKTGFSAHDLLDALEHECDERTIFRDLRDLQNAGFPLYKEENRWRVLTAEEGGFAVPIEASELLALLVSKELFDPIRATDVAAALERLRGKIAAMLTPMGRAYASELAGCMVTSFTSPSALEERDADLRLVEEAIQKEHRVQMVYWNPSGETLARRVDPYCLWFADGRLYLVGWCHLREDFRTFLMDRVRSVEVLDEDFEPQKAFDARAYIGTGFGVWHGKRYKVELLFAPEIAHLTAERRFHASQQVESFEDGSVLLTMYCAGLPHIASWLAGFGGRVVARAPKVLGQMVRDIHKNGAAAYAGEGSAVDPPDGS